jgi:hypothetical protein
MQEAKRIRRKNLNNIRHLEWYWYACVRMSVLVSGRQYCKFSPGWQTWIGE